MKDTILIVEHYSGRGDCIARLLHQFNVPYHKITLDESKLPIQSNIAGIILSGGPQSATKIHSDDGKELRPVFGLLDQAATLDLPTLGICLGHQIMGAWAGGKVEKLQTKIVGFRDVHIRNHSAIFNMNGELILQAFQYHEDHLRELPEHCEIIATSEDCDIEAFKISYCQMWGVQFHPEITLSDGEAIFENKPIPLHPWDPQVDVKAPYIIKSFSEICLADQSEVNAFFSLL